MTTDYVFHSRHHRTRTLHIVRRAWERYALKVLPEDVRRVEARFFGGRDPLIRPLREPDGTLFWAVRVNGQWVAMRFDSALRHAETCLPPRLLHPFRKDLRRVKQEFRRAFADRPGHPLWADCGDGPHRGLRVPEG